MRTCLEWIVASALLVSACGLGDADSVPDPGGIPVMPTGQEVDAAAGNAPPARGDGPSLDAAASPASDGGANEGGVRDASVAGGGGPPISTSGCGKPSAPGTFTRTKAVNGASREYVIKIPDAYDPNLPHPVLFAFHGAGSNGAGAIGGNDVIHGVPSIKVAPTNGDVLLVKELVADVTAELCVDGVRIFASGYSAGGFVADAVACQLGNLFRGAAVWEGGGNGSCPKPVAMWFNHNQDDTTVPISMGIAARDGWLQTNGCSTATTAFNPPSPCVLYACTKASVVWCSPATGGHKPAGSPIKFFSAL